MPSKPNATPENIARDKKLLEAAIKAEGLTTRAFAHDVLVRDDRTVRAWLAGKSTLPHPVRELCYSIVRAARRRDGRRRGGAGAAAALLLAIMFSASSCARHAPPSTLSGAPVDVRDAAPARSGVTFDTVPAPAASTAPRQHCVRMHITVPDMGGPVSTACPVGWATVTT